MNSPLTPNTQAILLLTAPLIAGRNEGSADLLTLTEYNRLARILREKQRQAGEFDRTVCRGNDQSLCRGVWPRAVGELAGPRFSAESGIRPGLFHPFAEPAKHLLAIHAFAPVKAVHASQSIWA
jgi:hypothetical protein